MRIFLWGLLGIGLGSIAVVLSQYIFFRIEEGHYLSLAQKIIVYLGLLFVFGAVMFGVLLIIATIVI
jgi:hypothetical protein